MHLIVSICMALEVYDSAIVDAHEQSPRFKTTLARVAIRDYGQDYGFSDNVAGIDIDAWETSLSGSNDKTMDVAVGIAEYANNHCRAKRLLLVELRMNYTGQGQNSKTSEMKLKESHTREMFASCPLDTRSFFVFYKSVAPCVRNRIARESITDKSLHKWEIVSPEEFVSKFHFVESLPYTPESPIDIIRTNGRDYIAASDFMSAIKLSRY